MSEIQQVNRSYPQLPVSETRGAGPDVRSPQRSPEPGADYRVEISEMAQALANLADMPDIRADKVAEVRGAIEAGTYETPDKWEAALDRIIADLA